MDILRFPITKEKYQDPNLIIWILTADLSKKENSYDFHIKVAYANLKKLQFVTDSISNFKGCYRTSCRKHA
jgi:hypothetical protein